MSHPSLCSDVHVSPRPAACILSGFTPLCSLPQLSCILKESKFRFSVFFLSNDLAALLQTKTVWFSLYELNFCAASRHIHIIGSAAFSGHRSNHVSHILCFSLHQSGIQTLSYSAYTQCCASASASFLITSVLPYGWTVTAEPPARLLLSFLVPEFPACPSSIKAPQTGCCLIPYFPCSHRESKSLKCRSQVLGLYA